MKLFKSRTERTLDDGVSKARDFTDDASSKAGKLVDDGRDQLHRVLDEIESALSSAKDVDVDGLKSNVLSKLTSARGALTEKSASVGRTLNDALGQADEVARQKPWHVVGAVAGLALVIGFLAGR
ncbi:DUF883 family protein [Chitinasiproducens palmae]|uniref:Membrane-anchored ribosome-binding protein, inhibits growth in stationary phase, ElaB/YqjD/DUF883 family n=1 Tax=Chitinasiproducens palmae TaxID=1770053 RepID=A0A1H2PRV1_9BURK|nr:DUF883 family protein [Chitinasiproducens palmae]SDV49654.1 Membrane-anchored ribosome-binding protein, inhibits growth in stationary phase, ElaB/YqjD/DUF883 family [Chitinasiproducens palmae]